MNSFQHENQILALVEVVGNQKIEINALRIDKEKLQKEVAELKAKLQEIETIAKNDNLCKILVSVECPSDDIDKMPWDE